MDQLLTQIDTKKLESGSKHIQKRHRLRPPFFELFKNFYVRICIRQTSPKQPKALKTQCFQGFFGTPILGKTNDLMINSHALLFLCHLHGFIWTYGAIFTPNTHSSIISTCKNNSVFSLYSQHLSL